MDLSELDEPIRLHQAHICELSEGLTYKLLNTQDENTALPYLASSRL